MNRRSMTVPALAIALVLALALPIGVAAKGRPVPESLEQPVRAHGPGRRWQLHGRDVRHPAAPIDAGLPDGPSRGPATRSTPAPTGMSRSVHKWQAQCYVDSTTSAAAAWGDNLTGDAKLRVGKPIRRGAGARDRHKPRRTAGFRGGEAGAVEARSRVRLRDPSRRRSKDHGPRSRTASPRCGSTTVSASFSVRRVATGAYVVPEGTPAKGEINATGRVVYGYQLKVTAKGQYEISVHPSERHHQRHGRRNLRRALGLAGHHDRLTSKAAERRTATRHHGAPASRRGPARCPVGVRADPNRHGRPRPPAVPAG